MSVRQQRNDWWDELMPALQRVRDVIDKTNDEKYKLEMMDHVTSISALAIAIPVTAFKPKDDDRETKDRTDPKT